MVSAGSIPRSRLNLQLVSTLMVSIYTPCQPLPKSFNIFKISFNFFSSQKAIEVVNWIINIIESKARRFLLP